MLKLFVGYALFVSSVLIGYSAVLCFYGDPLTTLVFGNEYQDYFVEHFGGENTTTFLLSVAMPCLGLSFLLTCCLLAADVPIYSFYAALVGLMATVIINYCFAEPTINTAATSFVVGAVATMLARVGLVWWAHRQQTRVA
jgi:O-antigen/teichoic acid export membrane protein